MDKSAGRLMCSSGPEEEANNLAVPALSFSHTLPLSLPLSVCAALLLSIKFNR